MNNVLNFYFFEWIYKLEEMLTYITNVASRHLMASTLSVFAILKFFHIKLANKVRHRHPNTCRSFYTFKIH